MLDVLPGLVDGPLAGLRVAALHGRMPPPDKDEVMTAFAEGRLDVLVATTVIEVGVDVANATVMAVLDADRFGMSQLHQLRGRIGRGSAPGVCLLETSAEPGSPSDERLVKAVASTVDGFELARFDLEARRRATCSARSSPAGASSRDARAQPARGTDQPGPRGGGRDHRRRPRRCATTQPSPQALADALDPERSEYLERA